MKQCIDRGPSARAQLVSLADAIGHAGIAARAHAAAGACASARAQYGAVEGEFRLQRRTRSIAQGHVEHEVVCDREGKRGCCIGKQERRINENCDCCHVLVRVYVVVERCVCGIRRGK